MATDRRTSDENPGERVTDQDFRGKLKWWWSPEGGRGYRDVWLIIITGLCLYAVILNGDRVDDINKTRADNLALSCKKSNENSAGINGLSTALQKIIVGGALLPGDVPSPKSDNPLDWKTIEEGPLSGQIQTLAEDFPDATARLESAKKDAQTLEDQEVAARDCDKEVQTVQSNG